MGTDTESGHGTFAIEWRLNPRLELFLNGPPPPRRTASGRTEPPRLGGLTAAILAINTLQPQGSEPRRGVDRRHLAGAD